MKADQMQARSRHQSGQALHEFQRRHPEVRGAVSPGALQLQHNVTRRIFFEPLVGDRRTRTFVPKAGGTPRNWAGYTPLLRPEWPQFAGGTPRNWAGYNRDRFLSRGQSLEAPLGAGLATSAHPGRVSVRALAPLGADCPPPANF